eukprot:646094-Prorocentrum_minimum.AAC.1
MDSRQLAADLVQFGSDIPFNIPPYFALLARAITLLEGMALVGCGAQMTESIRIDLQNYSDAVTLLEGPHLQ